MMFSLSLLEYQNLLQVLPLSLLNETRMSKFFQKGEKDEIVLLVNLHHVPPRLSIKLQ